MAVAGVYPGELIEAAAAALRRRWEADPPHQEVPGMAAVSPIQRYGFPDHDNPATWPKPPSDNGQSTVRVEIDHTNVPDRVNMRATTQGDEAEIGNIGGRRAMPQAGISPFNTFAVS